MDSLRDSIAELLHATMIGSKARWYCVIDIDDVPSNVKTPFHYCPDCFHWNKMSSMIYLRH
jgi:hypothetical protein